MSIKLINDTTFQSEVIQSKIPVVLEFWASWSADNNIILSSLNRLSGKFTTQIKFVRLDIDQSKLDESLNIREVPTLVLYVGGRKKATLKGTPSEAEIDKWIRDNSDI